MRQILAVLAFVTLVSAAVVEPAKAASPKEELLGIWKLRRGIGGPCGSLIVSLRYSFHRDGQYDARAEMRGTPGGTFEYHGTFAANDSSVTAFVDGTTVGPYPYSISGDRLLITQPEFRCQVEMEREDY